MEVGLTLRAGGTKKPDLPPDRDEWGAAVSYRESALAESGSGVTSQSTGLMFGFKG